MVEHHSHDRVSKRVRAAEAGRGRRVSHRAIGTREAQRAALRAGGLHGSERHPVARVVELELGGSDGDGRVGRRGKGVGAAYREGAGIQNKTVSNSRAGKPRYCRIDLRRACAKDCVQFVAISTSNPPTVGGGGRRGGSTQLLERQCQEYWE